MSFIERLNLLCPLFGVPLKRGSTVYITLVLGYTLYICVAVCNCYIFCTQLLSLLGC